MEKTKQYAVKCFKDEAAAILDLIPQLTDDFDKAIDLIYHSKGRLIVTGVGKSGHIGTKIAATLASTGTPSFFVNPLDAYHGDLGMFTPDDVVLAISYSARWEITNAVKKIASDVADGKIKLDGINEETVGQYLTTAGIPDPDLLIRTGGDCRISNYLLWQIAYAELYFTDKFWPDFSKEDFCDAIIKFQSRERRFGKTSEQVQEK